MLLQTFGSDLGHSKYQNPERMQSDNYIKIQDQDNKCMEISESELANKSKNNRPKILLIKNAFDNQKKMVSGSLCSSYFYFANVR
jgi:hypothetical protein